jgi:hypothetical protein
MATDKYWNGSAWEVIGTEADKVSIADSSNLFSATDVEGALKELFTNVSNGKTSIATSITDKGVSASGGDTFATLASKIRQISTGKKWATGTSRPVHYNTDPDNFGVIVRGLSFRPSLIVVERADGDMSGSYNRAQRASYKENVPYSELNHGYMDYYKGSSGSPQTWQMSGLFYLYDDGFRFSGFQDESLIYNWTAIG